MSRPQNLRKPARRPDVAGQQGFSVLEAIVAVAILGLALIPLYEMQSRTVAAVLGLERAEARLKARDVVLSSFGSVIRADPAAIELPVGYEIVRVEELGRGRARHFTGVPGRFELRRIRVVLGPAGAGGAGETLSWTLVEAVPLTPYEPPGN